MTSQTTLRPQPAEREADALDASALWSPAFPSTDMVDAAAALFSRVRRWNGSEGPRWRLVIAPGMVQVTSTDPARCERAHERGLARDRARIDVAVADLNIDLSAAAAGDTFDAMVGLHDAGMISTHDLEQAGEWADWLDDRGRKLDADDDELVGAARITSWSRKSRALMLRRLASLDYAPLFVDGLVPAMVTLTYPGNWLAVAPDAGTCKRHIDSLKRAYLRDWGTKWLGVWKREFQRRGAPHYHILTTPPTARTPVVEERPLVQAHRWDKRRDELVAVAQPRPRGFIGPMPAKLTPLIGPLPVDRWEGFKEWLSRKWADVVGAQRCTARGPVWDLGIPWANARPHVACCEYHRHLISGTGVDYAEGMRARDPKRLGIYFSKHGIYAAKDYQNDAPAEWIDAGTVGRFWGVWGLDDASVVVEVPERQALAASRTMRRWQRANGYRAQRTVWRKRYVETLDETTGELVRSWRWHTRRSGYWSGAKMRGARGFVIVNDGASFASQLARYVTTLGGRELDGA